jgi:hypothetical protein
VGSWWENVVLKARGVRVPLHSLWSFSFYKEFHLKKTVPSSHVPSQIELLTLCCHVKVLVLILFWFLFVQLQELGNLKL